MYAPLSKTQRRIFLFFIIYSNPARILCLSQKGNIAEGMDADLVLADQDTLEIDTVFARGQQMMSGKEILVKGTFE